MSQQARIDEMTMRIEVRQVAVPAASPREDARSPPRPVVDLTHPSTAYVFLLLTLRRASWVFFSIGLRGARAFRRSPPGCAMADHRLPPSFVVLQNPHQVTGSGYIFRPPQRPFEGPLTVQPPTVSVGISCPPRARTYMYCTEKVDSCFAPFLLPNRGWCARLRYPRTRDGISSVVRSRACGDSAASDRHLFAASTAAPSLGLPSLERESAREMPRQVEGKRRVEVFLQIEGFQETTQLSTCRPSALTDNCRVLWHESLRAAERVP